MDALREWMESDLDVIMETDLDVIMVRPWMLSEATKVCERTETATTKRRTTRQNAVETALPA